MTAACLASHSRTLAPGHDPESLDKALALRNDSPVCRKSLVLEFKGTGSLLCVVDAKLTCVIQRGQSRLDPIVRKSIWLGRAEATADLVCPLLAPSLLILHCFTPSPDETGMGLRRDRPPDTEVTGTLDDLRCS